MDDMEKCIVILDKTVKAVRQFNGNVPIIINVEFAEDILKLLKAQDLEIVRCKDCRYWASGRHECRNPHSYMQLGCCSGDWFRADGEV